MLPVLGVVVEYPTPEIFVPHARSGARPVAALAPGAPALLCPGTHATRPRDAASASIPQYRTALANSTAHLLLSRRHHSHHRHGPQTSRVRAPEVTPGAPAPRLFRRAPRPGPSFGRAPLPLRGARSLSAAVRLPRRPRSGFLSHLSARTCPVRVLFLLPCPSPSRLPPHSGPRLCRVAGASAAASPPPPRQDGHRRGR